MTKCEYALKPSHRGKSATQWVTVTYGAGFSEPDRDVLVLCQDCAEFVYDDATRHGYDVNRIKIEKMDGGEL